MCGTINYTSTILTLLELIAYYVALTFETLFSFENSIYLPFTFVRGITLQFFVLEIYSNVKKNIVGVILSCIFRAIKLGLAIYLWISMVSPQKKWALSFHFHDKIQWYTWLFYFQAHWFFWWLLLSLPTF